MPRPRADLKSYKDLIVGWYLNDKIPQIQILCKLRNEYNFEVSHRTLQRYLSEWDVHQKECNIDDIEAEIFRLFQVGLSYSRIIEYLREERPEISVSLRSLERRLQQWGHFRYEQVTYTEELVKHVREFVYHRNMRDKEILNHLQRVWGVEISLPLLIRIRLENNMVRKINDLNEQQYIRDRLHEFFSNYQQTSDLLGNLGRNQIWGIVRRHLKLNITRNLAYSVYREWYPEAVRQRFERGRFERTAEERMFTVPGPNYMWSMDGYQKLRFAGFEIYAGIDAYSRMMLWCNVSRSTSLSANVLNQYLLSITKLGFRPWLTRTDHGVETPLMAFAQFMLAMHSKPKVVTIDSDGNETVWQQGYRISESHKWGSSRQNRKIEQWWAQLLKSVTKRWIVYFKSLVNNGTFDCDNTVDQVALYAIYGDILRRECAEFVEQWNNHRITFTPGKNYRKIGHVYHMWSNVDGDATNFAIDMTDETDSDLMRLAQKLQEPLERYNFDNFLAPETQQLCDEWLMRYPLGSAQHDPLNPHRESYYALRDYLGHYVAEGRQPPLALNEMPRGGVAWYRGELDEIRYDSNQLQQDINELEAARREVQLHGDEYAPWFEMDVHNA